MTYGERGHTTQQFDLDGHSAEQELASRSSVDRDLLSQSPLGLRSFAMSVLVIGTVYLNHRQVECLLQHHPSEETSTPSRLLKLVSVSRIKMMCYRLQASFQSSRALRSHRTASGSYTKSLQIQAIKSGAIMWSSHSVPEKGPANSVAKSGAGQCPD